MRKSYPGLSSTTGICSSLSASAVASSASDAPLGSVLLDVVAVAFDSPVSDGISSNFWCSVSASVVSSASAFASGSSA